MAHVPDELLEDGANPVRGRGVRPARYDSQSSSPDRSPGCQPGALRHDTGSKRAGRERTQRDVGEDADGFIVHTDSEESDDDPALAHRPPKVRRRESRGSEDGGEVRAGPAAPRPDRSLRERVSRRDPALDRLLEARARTSAHHARQDIDGGPVAYASGVDADVSRDAVESDNSLAGRSREGSGRDSVSETEFPPDVTSSTDPAALAQLARREQRKRLRKKKQLQGEGRGRRRGDYGSVLPYLQPLPSEASRLAHGRSGRGGRSDAAGMVSGNLDSKSETRGDLRHWLTRDADSRSTTPAREEVTFSDDEGFMWTDDLRPVNMGLSQRLESGSPAILASSLDEGQPESVARRQSPQHAPELTLVYTVMAQLENTFDVVAIRCCSAVVESDWLRSEIATTYRRAYQVNVNVTALVSPSRGVLQGDVHIPVESTKLQLTFQATLTSMPPAASRWSHALRLPLAADLNDDLTLAMNLDVAGGGPREEDFTGALEAAFSEADEAQEFFAPAEAISFAMLPRVFRVIRHTVHLRTLDLSFVYLGPRGARQLSTILWALPLLSTLRLPGTGLNSQVRLVVKIKSARCTKGPVALMTQPRRSRYPPVFFLGPWATLGRPDALWIF